MEFAAGNSNSRQSTVTKPKTCWELGSQVPPLFPRLVVTPYEAALSNCLYLTEFLTDFGQILDSKSYDQA